MRLVHEFIPSGQNGRNSEGAFARLPSGRLLFAYSRFMETGGADGGRCDIALSHSDDEGETWSEPRVIAEAASFGVRNVMSVSKAEQQHYLDIPKGGAWTLMFEGRPRQKWGFIVNGHKWRPLRYFHKFGIRQVGDYQ